MKQIMKWPKQIMYIYQIFYFSFYGNCSYYDLGSINGTELVLQTKIELLVNWWKHLLQPGFTINIKYNDLWPNARRISNIKSAEFYTDTEYKNNQLSVYNCTQKETVLGTTK